MVCCHNCACYILVCLFAVLIAFFVNEKSYGTQRTVDSTDSILITGASSGIGRHAALAMNAVGFKVFVGLRKMSDFTSLHDVAVAPERMIPVILDVTKDDHFAKALEKVEQEVGDAGLTAIFGNAGTGFSIEGNSGALEFSEIEHWKWIYDVNVFGNVRLIKHFLPLLKKSGRGRIIINTSIAGFSSIPFFLPYASTKWAMEGICAGLREEVYPFNIEVSCLEPGYVRSKIASKSIENLGKLSQLEYAYPQERQFYNNLRAIWPSATSPKCTSDLLIDAVLSSRPNHRYTCGGFSLFVGVYARLPSQVALWISKNSPPNPMPSEEEFAKVIDLCHQEDFKAEDYVNLK